MILFSLRRATKLARNLSASKDRWSGLHLVPLAILLAMLVSAPRAIADDINPDADIPDFSTLDDAPANQVLEIPQQCDQSSVATLCTHSWDDSFRADAGAANADAIDSSMLASNPDVGGLSDYANQSIVGDRVNVPMGYLASYPVMAPGPRVVMSGPGSYQQWAGGPGSYQQWAPGPGTYRQMAPGPGYIAPMPLGFHPYGLGGGFAPHPFGGMGGGRFGRR